ncbi:MAG: BlaI/MecI/CopY family transcriptional regulator [Gemmatimonadales bacterium]
MPEAKAKPTLSRREREVMDILYRRSAATVVEVMDELADPPSYSAVRSILRVLKEKGHIVHKEDGPRYVYLPAVARERARTVALDHLVDTFFDGSAERALVALLERSDLDLPEAAVRRLASEIRKAGEEGR